MGHIAIVTPPRISKGTIVRRKVSDKEILAESQIERHYYAGKSGGDLGDITFQKLENIVTNRNELHHHTWSHLYIFAKSLPMWKGYMSQYYEQVRFFSVRFCIS